MRLEDLQFNVRQRSHWQALDLGTLLAKRCYSRLLTLWLVAATPTFLLAFALLWEYPLWAVALIWWLKPLYERMPLKYLSRTVFADQPDFRGALVDGWRAMRPGMLPALTYRRLSPTRSFVAPVYVLEGLAGEQRAGRLAVLQPKAGSAAIWLTVLGIHVESFLLLALLAFAYLLLPSGVEVDWLALALEADEIAVGWFVNLLTFAAMAVVAPFYVAGGFALYLNRRVELEAWDVELGLRRLAHRLAGAAAVTLVLALPGFDALALEAPAEPTEPLPAAGGPFQPATVGGRSPQLEESRAHIARVLSQEDFHQQRTTRYPAFLRDLFGRDASDAAPPQLGWLAAAARWIARAVEVALWVLVFLALFWLVRRVSWARVGSARLQRQSAPPAFLNGLPVGAGTLPDDVPGSARALWMQGAEREALALIYRAALSRLMTIFGCVFVDSDTEADCLRRVRVTAPPAQAVYLAELTDAWIRLAYAHGRPDAQQFEKLCVSWPALLEVPRHAT